MEIAVEIGHGNLSTDPGVACGDSWHDTRTHSILEPKVTSTSDPCAVCIQVVERGLKSGSLLTISMITVFKCLSCFGITVVQIRDLLLPR